MLTCGKALFARHNAERCWGVVQFLCSQICKWLQCKCAVVALCGEATLRRGNLVKVCVHFEHYQDLFCFLQRGAKQYAKKCLG